MIGCKTTWIWRIVINSISFWARNWLALRVIPPCARTRIPRAGLYLFLTWCWCLVDIDREFGVCRAYGAPFGFFAILQLNLLRTLYVITRQTSVQLTFIIYELNLITECVFYNMACLFSVYKSIHWSQSACFTAWHVCIISKLMAFIVHNIHFTMYCCILST